MIGKLLGEGDCTFIDGADGYLYAYCLRANDWRTIVARAHDWQIGPGGWMKYFNGSWSQPGLGGEATGLTVQGTTVGFHAPTGRTFMFGGSEAAGGFKLSVSSDHVNFTELRDPLVHYNQEKWVSRNEWDQALYSYPSVLNPEDGSRALGDGFNLWYSYLPPGKAEGTGENYLVVQNVH